MTELVRQRNTNDCLFACAAMALGMTYDEAEARAGAAFMNLLQSQGCNNAMENALLGALGLKVNVDYCMRTFNNHWTSVGFVKNMLWGRRAIVTVRSRNNRDGSHAVYWDGSKLFDPCTQDVYPSWDEVEPVEAVIFNERP